MIPILGNNKWGIMQNTLNGISPTLVWKVAVSMRIIRLNSLKHSGLPGIVQGQNEHNRATTWCLEGYCVITIVMVYTNGWAVQDIAFTD